ncbi:MAG TPA: class I SAM-dependent methyltransferase [Blastocatellia bacterium]|nr:class I SAM-dependent methyltransferase [Blastocatellia bacterium]
MDVRDYNRRAWDKEVERSNEWTLPVDPQVIEAARRGRWSVLLTETKPVPSSWFPDLKDLRVLCLASGGGQQGPVLAAAGASVTVFDNSTKQLEQDRLVAERDSLRLETVEGDMADLSVFPDESFDLVFHPCSNLFIPDVQPVWREAFRVLRRGGALLAGFLNPAIYIFDRFQCERGILEVKHRLPYSDLTALSDEEMATFIEKGEPLEFSHTLTDQIGGQTEAGFVISGFYEDHHRNDPVAKYMPTYIATRAIKP